MSHFTVMVFGENPEEKLIPYQENDVDNVDKKYLEFNEDDDCDIDPETGKKGYWQNPNAKWDWYQLGGRWEGFFRTVGGMKVDQLKRALIDLKYMRDENQKNAEETLAFLNPFLSTSDKSIFFKWEIFLARVEKNEITIEKAREEYHAQSLVKAFKGIPRDNPYVSPIWDNVEVYLIPEKDYIQNAINKTIVPFAIITEDGKWYEKGDMGWWGCVSDEKDQGVWNKEFHKYFDSLSKTTLVSLYDCHI